MAEKKKYTEIIWYGRGGQGAITASQLIAEAAAIDGYEGITTAPSFGAERRGAPVAAFLRLAHEPIRIFSQISDPDVIVVLDPTLLPILDLRSRFRRDAILVLNTTKKPSDLGLDHFEKAGVADVTKVALDNGLTVAGVAILNTPILGAFVKSTGLVKMDSVEEAISERFPGAKSDLNIKTARLIYDSTTVYGGK